MSNPLAVILEGTVEEGCTPEEEAEIRTNSDEISKALRAIGYRVEIVTLTFDLEKARRELVALKPEIVFNLVDSIEGKGDLITLAPLLLSNLGIPYTGANAVVTTVTCDKLLTKQLLVSRNLKTSDWLTEAEIESGGPELECPYILKSITEHASFGMFADSVVSDRATLKKRWREKKAEYGSEWFAEEYIEGREFNQGVLAGANVDGAFVLPPSEIVFTDEFPKDKPRIVDYAAKWYTHTAEYKGTVRNFELIDKEPALGKQLQEMARECWFLFNLSGYARVDFRVDEKNVPYVLEVNSNPFLTEHEGFGVAAKHAGLSFHDTIRAIMADTYRRSGRNLPQMLAA